MRCAALCGLATLAAVWLIAASAGAAPAVPAWSLLPQPAQASMDDAHAFTVTGAATVVVRGSDSPAVLAIAHRFARRVAATRGLQLRVVAAPATDAAITFSVDPHADVAGDAGYRVRVDAHGIAVTARTPKGAFYGGVTVWQLLAPPGWVRGTPAPVAYGVINDHPRFGWRGVLLDSGRHFQRVSDIEKLIDWMSLHKLNVLLWHITDDQGWRLAVPKYPELTRIGACRKAVGLDIELTGSADKPYCGFYTEADVRAVVKYAAARFVTIVPGIDLPGHSQAAIAAYPWLGVTGKRPQVWTDWGISPWLLNPDARTLTFVDNVLDEVMQLFPSKYISIGGDEADKQQWEAAPGVQAEMRRLHLANMNALQAWFMGKVAEHLLRHGRIPVGWDDQIAEGGTLPASQVVMAWHAGDGGKVALQAIAEGHDVIMAPESTLYLDHYQSDLPDEWPGRPSMTTLAQAYATDVIPAAASPAQAAKVLGVQAQMWTELQPSFARIEHALSPRLAALSEVAWSPASARNQGRFMARVPAELARYRALGIGYADSAFTPVFTVTAASDNLLQVALANQSGVGSIRYTTDGNTPTVGSTAYSTPLKFPLHDRVTLRAATFAADGLALSAPRTRVLDAQTLRHRSGNSLAPCRNNPLMRLGGHGSAHGGTPTYKVDVGDMCWQWHDAPLAYARRVTLTTERLAWRYGDEHDNVVVRPRLSAAGEFELHSGSCAGPVLATLPLAAAVKAGGTTKLSAPLAGTTAGTGARTLCIDATGDPRDGQWVLSEVTLSP